MARNAGRDGDRFSGHAGDGILRWADATVGLQGKRLLDFGCGTGILLEKAGKRFHPSGLMGTDYSPSSVKETKRRCSGLSAFEAAWPLTGFPCSLDEASCDVAFLVEVIEHLYDEDVDATLAELRRVLRSGGHLVVTTPNDEDLSRNSVMCPECGATFHTKQHVRSWTATALEDRLRSSGFEPLETAVTNWTLRSRAPMRYRLREAVKRILGIQGTANVHLGIIARRT
jgi:ubiquinone/menaquinone biosynthesis C-methylase UbiE